ncbi:MAG: bifunctional diguanylate cyclase/phosphodiesterase [Synechococcaceae cyanobacterium]|nr:bifunctional diguanylate cyclase/phosphodiesterase [Synechococcaceae cyanobacterium]
MRTVPWSLHLLSELLSGFSLEDPDALPKVINRVAEAVDAEVVALLSPGRVRHAIGLNAGDRARLLQVAASRPEGLALAVGGLHLHWAPLESEEMLVAGRLGEAFDLEERSLLRAMARTIQLCLKLLAAVAAERSAREAAVLQASRDTMTGLPSRAAVLDHLEALLAEPAAAGATTVLFIDIDRFKQINDVHGHAAGDQFLIAVAGVLRSVVRPQDLVGRLSGDEFVVITRTRARADAADLAQRVITAIEAPLQLAGRMVRHSASVGIAFAEPGDDAERLIENADLAMYGAKDLGRGRFAWYEPSLRQRAQQRAAVEAELRRALACGELEPHFQPIIHQREQRLVGFEALARWRHPERGLLPPAAFIPVAQETGQILEIDRQILERACQAVAGWKSHDPSQPLSVSVNVSGRTLADPSLVPWVVQVLGDTGLAPGRLYLEITETMLVEDRAATSDTLNRLRGLGIRLAIDDFGTGYSSLLYLKRFPVGILKIDRSFIDGLGRDRGDEVIVEAVVGVARALGIELIAEGVETPGQAERLLALGCDRLQGFLFSPAREAATIEAMLPAMQRGGWSG